jgi:hypothetical protein
MPGNNKAVEISGFELAFLVANSSIPHGVVRVLSQLANLAASTPRFFISRSHKRIAEEMLCSESTVRRAFKWAVENGVLTKQAVIHEKTNARLPNMYRFSSPFLAYARDVKAKLIAKNLTFFSPLRAVRDVIESVRVFLNFHPQTPVQKEHPPHGQNDQDKNKNSSSRKTKTSDPGEPDSCGKLTRIELISEVAAAKAAASNKRGMAKHALERMLNEIADRKARGFAWAKWLRGREKRSCNLLEPSYNYEGLPTITTVSEMMKRCSGGNESAVTDHRIPEGFTG